MEVQRIWTSDCPGAPKGDRSLPDLEPGHVSAPFVLENSQYVSASRSRSSTSSGPATSRIRASP
eukprot:9724457-Alexandrium_andersonii.AAC.1